MWLGVGTAVGLSVVLGAVLTYGTRRLSFEAQELIGGVASIVAVGFVTVMVFWMRSAARSISGELKGRLDRALDLGPLAVALVGFLGVGREGLETAIFFYATAQAAGAGNNLPLLGWLVGFAGAVALGWLIYRGALRIDLGRFFRWTGVALVLVAGGILSYGIHDLQEAGVLPGLNNLAFDVSGVVDPGTWYAAAAQGNPELHAPDHGAPGGRLGAVRRHRALLLPPPEPAHGRAGALAARPPPTVQRRRPPDPACPRAQSRPNHLQENPCALAPSPSLRPSPSRPGWPSRAARPVQRAADRRRRGRVRWPDHRRRHRHHVRGRALAGAGRHGGVHRDQLRQQGQRVLRLRRGRPHHGRGGERRAGAHPQLPRRAAEPGTYETACKPGMVGDGIRAPFTVTGTSAAPKSDDENLAAATTEYQRYVSSQTDALLTRTTEFVALVKAGKVEEAKALFPTARTYWERIEPVAESFGDLDPKIDGRDEVIEEGMEFTGFHRLEQRPVGDRPPAGLGRDRRPAARRRQRPRRQGQGRELNPLQLANGAKALLDEVATGKITGEEERYSHTDLWDFEANVEGSRAAIEALRPSSRSRPAAGHRDRRAGRRARRPAREAPRRRRLHAVPRADAGRGQGPHRRARRPRAAGLDRSPAWSPRDERLLAPGGARRRCRCGRRRASPGSPTPRRSAHASDAGAAPTSAPADAGVVAFRGEHQAGITTAAQDRLHFVAFDVITDDPAELRDLLTRWTRAAERMTAGAEAAPAAPWAADPEGAARTPARRWTSRRATSP